MNLLRKTNLLFVIFIGLSGFLNAQNQNISPSNEELITDLVERHKKVGLLKQTTPGYRIQLYFGSERSKANEIKTDFSNNFSNTPSYLLYQQPNFKVRVGDFKTRMEAFAFLESLKEFYSTSFIVPDDIKLPKRELYNSGSGYLGSQGVVPRNYEDKNKIAANLTGRNIRILPPLNLPVQEEGKVVLEISVDSKGNVVMAEGPARGSTTTSTALLKLAKEAAFKTKFTEIEVSSDSEVNFQKGTLSITFHIE
ncbi:MAG: SPOR domain-containing protein [Bacteroidota bacterium]